MPLYEKEPAVKLGTSHLIAAQAGLTARRTDWTDRAALISLWPSRVEGQGLVGGCAGGPIPYRGRQATSGDSGACRGERFVLGEDVPDGFGELAGDVDAGNLGAALAAEAVLVPLVAIPIAGIAGGVGGGFDERPAQVLGAVLGQRSADDRGCPTGARSGTARCSRRASWGSRTGRCRRSREAIV